MIRLLAIALMVLVFSVSAASASEIPTGYTSLGSCNETLEISDRRRYRYRYYRYRSKPKAVKTPKGNNETYELAMPLFPVGIQALVMPVPEDDPLVGVYAAGELNPIDEAAPPEPYMSAPVPAKVTAQTVTVSRSGAIGIAIALALMFALVCVVRWPRDAQKW
jgi:hypothetical protein